MSGTTGSTVTPPRVSGPNADGFYAVQFEGDGHNAGYGRLLARGEGDNLARVRIETGQRSSNVRGTVHGGFMLSFLDQAIFIGPSILKRIEFPGAVTLTMATQFMAGADIARPLDCLVEILRETGKLLFVRGTLEQGDAVLLSFEATLRKFAPRPA